MLQLLVAFTVTALFVAPQLAALYANRRWSR